MKCSPRKVAKGVGGPAAVQTKQKEIKEAKNTGVRSHRIKLNPFPLQNPPFPFLSHHSFSLTDRFQGFFSRQVEIMAAPHSRIHTVKSVCVSCVPSLCPHPSIRAALSIPSEYSRSQADTNTHREMKGCFPRLFGLLGLFVTSCTRHRHHPFLCYLSITHAFFFLSDLGAPGSMEVTTKAKPVSTWPHQQADCHTPMARSHESTWWGLLLDGVCVIDSLLEVVRRDGGWMELLAWAGLAK